MSTRGTPDEIRSRLEYRFPATIGRDLADVVARAGPSVTRFSPATACSVTSLRNMRTTARSPRVATALNATDPELFDDREGANVWSLPDTTRMQAVAELMAAGRVCARRRLTQCTCA